MPLVNGIYDLFLVDTVILYLPCHPKRYSSLLPVNRLSYVVNCRNIRNSHGTVGTISVLSENVRAM